MKKYAIVVAGGKGMRMGAALPKQYLPLDGIPILMRTLSAFFQYPEPIELILVIPLKDFDYWKQLCQDFNFTVPHQLVEGGASRFHSVKNGLDSIAAEEGLVAIHDGVRPFVRQEVIEQSFLEAQRCGSAVAVVPLKDSLRKVNPHGGTSY